SVIPSTSEEARAESCDEVPAGYSPLQNAKVEFLAADGSVLSTTLTDRCGYFSAEVDAAVSGVQVIQAGFRTLQRKVDYFQQTAPGLVSMMPEAAEYQIASIQLAGRDSLAFTVSDSVTNKAVIGLPASAVNVSINTDAVKVLKYNNATAVSEPASVVFVMDASPSMHSVVRDKQGNDLLDTNGQSLTRYRMSALAAHLYLDGVSDNDETAFVIFDRNAVFMDDAAIADLLELSDSQARPTAYSFSKDGFSSSASSLRFVVDAYNPYSTLYNSFAYDARHPATPDLKIANYPWDSYTAMYDGIFKALERVSSRTTLRSMVIAMSDGEDNSSTHTEQEVIARARQDGIPVFTITYGEITGSEQGGADVASMARIAEQTNATPFLVEGPDIGKAFQSIQSGIAYQYLAVLDRMVGEGDLLELTLNDGGLTAARSLQP
ncbi:MAG: hypothetical protein KDJ38_18020, partial [Gammaproteobacteria bacterium]|nr:hypothetical protein [Gammaproteobacteria bacterium]